MADLIVHDLGKLSSIANGTPVQAKSGGNHSVTATVQGTGSVSFSGQVMGTNDIAGTWMKVATVTGSGTTTASGSATFSDDYRFWRFDVTAMTGTSVLAVLATDPLGTGAPSTPSGAVVLRLGQIGSKCRIPQQKDTTIRQARSRMTHWNFQDVIANGWAIEWPNFAISAGTPEAGPGATLSIVAAIEYPVGTFTQLTFGGATIGSIPDGGRLQCDPINVAIPKLAAYREHTFVYTSGAWIPLAAGSANMQNDGLNCDTTQGAMSGLTDTTLTNPTLTQATQLSANYGACAILAQTSLMSAFGDGDSIMQSVGDNGYYIQWFSDTDWDAEALQWGAQGFFERGLGYRCPTIRAGANGEKVSNLATLMAGTGYENRTALAKYCRAAVIMCGINDVVNTSDSRTTIVNNIQSIAAAWHTRGIPPYWCTMAPGGVISTDGYTTQAGQTLQARNNIRADVNEYLRQGKLTNVSGTVETAAQVEAGKGGQAGGTGYWRTFSRGRVLSDVVGNGTKTVTSATANFDQNDTRARVTINGLDNVITRVVSATTIEVQSTVAAASGLPMQIGYAMYTGDGTHGSHYAMARALRSFPL
jgi:hypothetical protein